MSETNSEKSSYWTRTGGRRPDNPGVQFAAATRTSLGGVGSHGRVVHPCPPLSCVRRVGVAVLVPPPVSGDSRGCWTVIRCDVADGWIVIVDAGLRSRRSPLLALRCTQARRWSIAVRSAADVCQPHTLVPDRPHQSVRPWVVSDAIVAMVDQDGTQPHVFQTMATGLTGKVAGTIRIPPTSIWPQVSNITSRR